MANTQGGLTVPPTGQRSSNPEAKNLFAEDPAPAPVGPGTAPIPLTGAPLSLSPGTWLCIFNCHADGSGVTAPGIALGLGGVPAAPTTRFFTPAVAQNATSVGRFTVPPGPNALLEAFSLGTAASTSFLERSLTAIRVDP